MLSAISASGALLFAADAAIRKISKSGGTLFGTRRCLQSLVCYTLVPADAEKGLRADAASTCSAAEGCADGRGNQRFLPTQRRLAEEPMVYVLLPAAAAFFLSGRNCVNLTRFLFTVSGAFFPSVVCPCSFAPHVPAVQSWGSAPAEYAWWLLRPLCSENRSPCRLVCTEPEAVVPLRNLQSVLVGIPA